MRKMELWMFAAILICGSTLVLSSCSSDDPAPTNPGSGEPTDYSIKDHWLSLPQLITKDVDAFYIYSTVYVE